MYGDPPSSNDHAGMVLDALSSFMAEAAVLDEVQALCAAAARSLSRATGLAWIVHLRDREDEDAMAWQALADPGVGERWQLADPSPRHASVGASWVWDALESSGRAAYRELEAVELGLEGGGVLPRVELRRVAGRGAVSAWLAAIVEGTETELDLAHERLATLVGQHLVAAASARRVESLRRDTQLRYQTLVEQIPAVIYHRRVDVVEAPLFVSPQVEAMLGYPPEHFLDGHSKFAEILHPDDRERILRGQRASIGMREIRTSEYRLIHRDGHSVWVSNRALAVPGRDGASRVRIGVLFDVTEIKRLETQYHQAQKLEAVGRFASGIAHDFNNILGVILSYAGMLELESDSAKADRSAIVDAVERGRSLVAQLLSFGRPQVPERRPLDLGALVEDMRAMLGPVLGPSIRLELEVDAELGPVLADRGQLEQIVMNLLVNARDAMPEGGRLGMVLRNLSLVEGLNTNYAILQPGEYVLLEVEDTGSGMDEATLEHLFEPFFTTKAEGKGTGLGMSVVLGIVRSHAGGIGVDSAPGRGTRVRLYLPRS